MPIRKALKEKFARAISPDSSINKWLTQRTLENRQQGDYSPIYIGELYQQFQMSGTDYKGQLSTGFGELGISAAVNVKLSVAPIPTEVSPVSLTVGAEIEGTCCNRKFIALQCQPQRLFIGSSIYKANFPLCIMSYVGKRCSLSTGLNVNAQMGLPPITENIQIGPETATLSLETSVQAQAKAKYELTYIHLRANFLDYFSSPQDSRLTEKFEELIAIQYEKKDLKEQIYQWIETNFSHDEVKITIHHRKKLWKKQRFTPYCKTEDLTEALETITKLTHISQEKKDNAVKYQNELKKNQSQLENDLLDNKGLSEQAKNNCYLSLWGHQGQASAEASATAKVSLIPKGDIKGAIEGRLAHTAYRFQTMCNIPNLISTQDTVIEYRQAKLQAGLTLGKKEKNKQGDIYNMMLYHSASVYWLEGRATQWLPGSGLCFGMSVLVKRLIELAQNSASHPNLLNTLSSKLNIPSENLIEFLRNSYFSEVTADEFPAKTVLVESAFTLPVKYQIPVNKNSQPDQKLLTDMKEKFTASPAQFTLEAIRVRYRIADLKENTKTLFKLGLQPPGVGLGIKLSQVTQVGQEGIVDLYVHWFAENLRQFNTNGKMSEAYDLAIPPVALLHQ